jgi:hypothetical protein
LQRAERAWEGMQIEITALQGAVSFRNDDAMYEGALSRFRSYTCCNRTRLPTVSSVVPDRVIELLWKDSPDSVSLDRTAVRVNVSEVQRRPRHQRCEQSSNRRKRSSSVRSRLQNGR